MSWIVRTDERNTGSHVNSDPMAPTQSAARSEYAVAIAPPTS